MKINKVLLVVTVLLCIITINIYSFTSEDVAYSDAEYRAMASLPDFDTESLLDGSYFSKLEKYNLDQISVRAEMINYNAQFQNLMGVKIRNGYVIIDNELLVPYTNYMSVDHVMLDEYAVEKSEILNNIKEASQDKVIIFIDVADKEHIYQERFPYGMKNNDEFKYSKTLRTMEEASQLGYLTLSADNTLRQHLSDNIFYKSDHHFTMEGASYVYEFLIESLNDNFNAGLNSEPWDTMRKETSSFPFSGSEGRAIGDMSFSMKDVHTIGYPSQIEEYLRYESGELSELPLIGSSSPATYGSIMSGDKANTVILTDRPDLPSILFIGDSFTNALEYLSINDFNEIHSLDPRHYQDSIYEYIEACDVDYVVIVRDSLLSFKYYR